MMLQHTAVSAHTSCSVYLRLSFLFPLTDDRSGVNALWPSFHEQNALNHCLEICFYAVTSSGLETPAVFS